MYGTLAMLPFPFSDKAGKQPPNTRPTNAGIASLWNHLCQPECQPSQLNDNGRRIDTARVLLQSDPELEAPQAGTIAWD